RIPAARIQTRAARARAAIALADRSGLRHREPLLREAARFAHAVAREPQPFASATSALLLAGLAAVRGEHDAATARRERGERAPEELEMLLPAASARRSRGVLVGGDDGKKLVATADEWMTSEGIQNPARMAAMVAPGFMSGRR